MIIYQHIRILLYYTPSPFSNGTGQYHYLGYRQIVGNHLKYIAFIADRPIACLGWGSAAWKLKSRDNFIGNRYDHFLLTDTEII